MKKKILLTMAITAVLAGCNSSSESVETPENPESGKPGIGVIPFSVTPYLQRPMTDSMTVRFELDSEERTVYYRKKGTEEWVAHEATRVPVIHNAYHLENLVEAELNNLDSHSFYEYYVETDFGQTPVYQFKTWPTTSDVEDGHVYKFGHYADTHAHNYISTLVDGLIAGECDDNPAQCADELASIYIAGDVAGYLGHDHEALRKTLNLFGRISPYVPVSISFGNHDKDKFWETPKMFFKLPEISDSENVDKDIHWWEDRYLDTWIAGHNSEIERTDSHDQERQAKHWETRIRAHSNDYHAEEHAGIAYDLINYSMMMTHFSCESETWQDKKQTVCDWIDINDAHSSNAAGTRNRWLGLHIYGHNHGGFNIGQSMNAPTVWAGLPSATRECRNCYGHVEFPQYESRWAGRGVMIAEMTYRDFKHEDGRDRRNMTIRVLDKTDGYDTTNEIKILRNTEQPAQPMLTGVSGSIDMANQPQEYIASSSEFSDPADYGHHETHWKLDYTDAEGKAASKDVWGKDTRARYWMYDTDRNEDIDLTEYDLLPALTSIYENINQGHEIPRIVDVTVSLRHRNEFFTWSPFSEKSTVSLTEDGAEMAR